MTDPVYPDQPSAAPEPEAAPADPERLSRLSARSTPPVEAAPAEDVIREYERRYRPADADFRRDAAAEAPYYEAGAPDGDRKRKPAPFGFEFDFDRVRAEGAAAWHDRKRKDVPRSYSTLALTDDEKLWAGVAHASVWLTLFGGLFTFGTLVPLSIFVPLAIYFLFRKRSDYVAFHALQAFTIQALGTVGALVLFTLGGIVWSIGMVVAVLAMIVLVGFILVPLWGLVGLALLLITLLLPVAMLLLGTIAAIETYNGRDYRLPRVARWIDQQMAGGVFQA